MGRSKFKIVNKKTKKLLNDLKMFKSGDWVKVYTEIGNLPIWIEVYSIEKDIIKGRIDEWTDNYKLHGYNLYDDVTLNINNIWEIYQNYKG